MGTNPPPDPPELRGQATKANSPSQLSAVIRETVRLWRRHHLDHDRSKYVVEQVRQRLGLTPPRTRRRTVERLDRAEVERLIETTYRTRSRRASIKRSPDP